MLYYLNTVKWFISDLIERGVDHSRIHDLIEMLKKWLFLQQYKRHLVKRIEKNNFGRREEW